jgi:hypothetical protein
MTIKSQIQAEYAKIEAAKAQIVELQGRCRHKKYDIKLYNYYFGSNVSRFCQQCGFRSDASKAETKKYEKRQERRLADLEAGRNVWKWAINLSPEEIKAYKDLDREVRKKKKKS